MLLTLLAPSYYRKFIERVSAVQLEDIQRVGKQYIGPLFDPQQTHLAVCCHPSKVSEVVEEFHEYVILIDSGFMSML